ncbi:unnamed protein product [Medioppia subpectinata]|uniref:Uncharacterized protein n=1 Tax=Medioppia subpectinata TaxID=1979941 RepID=A0A7R9Q8G9_9ACAR|nr:unnamed protein product [Medioppia subpectinata]CAG2115824.1 unnamed protein product [Medioppia subpectinata]
MDNVMAWNESGCKHACNGVKCGKDIRKECDNNKGIFTDKGFIDHKTCHCCPKCIITVRKAGDDCSAGSDNVKGGIIRNCAQGLKCRKTDRCL